MSQAFSYSVLNTKTVNSTFQFSGSATLIAMHKKAALNEWPSWLLTGFDGSSYYNLHTVVSPVLNDSDERSYNLTSTRFAEHEVNDISSPMLQALFSKQVEVERETLDWLQG